MNPATQHQTLDCGRLDNRCGARTTHLGPEVPVFRAPHSWISHVPLFDRTGLTVAAHAHICTCMVPVFTRSAGIIINTEQNGATMAIHLLCGMCTCMSALHTAHCPQRTVRPYDVQAAHKNENAPGLARAPAGACQCQHG